MADISKLNFGNGGGSNDIKDAKAFRTDDAAETAIADDDYFPFYDASASTKKKSTWSNVKTVLGETFVSNGPIATPIMVDFAPVITMDNALGVNAVDIKAKIEPVQSGSGIPNPTNIRPITGWNKVKVTRSGKNLYIGSPSFSGYSSNGSWTKQSETYNGHEVYKQSQAWGGIYKFIYLGEGTYTFSASVKTNDGGNIAIFANLVDVTTAKMTPVSSDHIPSSTSWSKYSHTLTVEKAGTVAFRVERESTGDIYISEYQLEQGSTSTPYEPYQGKDYLINLGDTYYGGTLDVTSGVLTLTHKILDAGNLNYTKYDVTQGTLFRSGDITDIQKGPASNVVPDIKCSNYAAVAQDNIENGTLSCGYNMNSIDIIDNTYSDAATFKTAMSGVQVVYPLATPQTITLTPTQIKMLQGNNTLFADSGDTQLTYYNSTIGNIGEVVGELENDKANKSDLASINVTGTTNNTGSVISSGTYFYLNGTLVKAKVDIASGATFTKNTNYEEVTAGALNDIHNVLTMNTNADLATLRQGINAVKFVSGFTITNSQGINVQLANNMRGYVVRNGNVLSGIISTYNSITAYLINSTSVNSIESAREL